MRIAEIIWLLAVVLTAVTGVVALFHLLELPGRHRLAYAHVVAVHHTMYRAHRPFGAIAEPLALLLAAAVLS